MINIKKDTGNTVIRLVNYRVYNDKSDTENDKQATPKRHRSDEIKEYKNIKKYNSEKFLVDWNNIRTEKLNKPSNVKRLDYNLKSVLEDIIKHYEPIDIQNAMKALFAQDNISFKSMTATPKHFLQNFEVYNQAYLDRDDKLYGAKPMTA